ncbi:acyl carrier protein [Vibrio sp. PP-XX7]
MIISITGLSPMQFNADANWFALGLDSLVIVQIQQAVIKRFGIEFELGNLMGELDTCNKLGEKVRTLLPDEVPDKAPEADGQEAFMSGTNQIGAGTASSDTALLQGIPTDASQSLQTLCQQQIASMNALFAQQLAVMQRHEPSQQGMNQATPSIPSIPPIPSAQPTQPILSSQSSSSLKATSSVVTREAPS